jgi:hypothetical protein
MKKQYEFTLNKVEKTDIKENLNHCPVLEEIYLSSINGTALDIVESIVDNGDIDDVIHVHQVIKRSLYASLWIGLFSWVIFFPLLFIRGEMKNSFSKLNSNSQSIGYISTNIAMMRRIKRAIKRAAYA